MFKYVDFNLGVNLIKDFGLKEDAIESFSGSDSDVEQQKKIEDFGQGDSKVRILLCSDAGSQGVNLHFYCHRMVNYDIPWSLITLEQRNGRIDRYGQKKTPYIYYLVAHTETEAIKTDLHIINKLTIKEEEVHKTLGDAGSVMHLHDANEEEKKTIEALQNGDESFLEKEEEFDFSSLFDDSENTSSIITDNPYEEAVTVFPNDYNYYNNIQGHLNFSSKENFGTFFHNVISKVYSNFSVGFDFLDSLSTQTNLDISYIDKTKTILNKLQNNKSLSFIYDSNQIIYNEREFRSSESEILRLDRLIIKDNHAIIIDYKTSKGKNDISQVSNYLSNINICGFNKVSAFLLYVSNQELLEVTS